MQTEEKVRETIRELWSEVLERDQIPDDMDFFAAGGSSLKSLILLTELNDAFATEFEIAELVDCRTIDRQAGAVWRRLTGAPGATRDEPAVIVPLARAAERNGRDVVLVAVHDVGGDIYGYTSLAGELSGRVDLHGIRLPHERFDAPRALSIPDLAAEYAAALESAFDGSRRLVILGWSLGGLIGFELAKLLDGRGRPVRRLVLVDSPYRLDLAAADDAGPGDFPPEHERALIGEFDWLGEGERLCPEGASVEEMWRAVRARLDAPVRERLTAELRDRFPLLARVVPHLASLNPVEFVGYLNRFRSVLRAGRAYRPAGQTGAPIEFLAATGSDNFDPRWATHTSATFRRHPLDGDHFSILDRGLVRATARAILDPDRPPSARLR